MLNFFFHYLRKSGEKKFSFPHEGELMAKTVDQTDTVFKY